MTLTPPAPAAGPTAASLLPWEGKATRSDWAIVAAIVASTVYGLIQIPLVPALLGSHPLLLEAISGSMLAEVTVGAHSRLGEVHLAVAVLAGIPASMMFDWAFWWAGRRWGDRALTLLLGRSGGPRGQLSAAKRAARLERIARRFGPVAVLLAYFLPVPSPLVYVAAGLAEMRLWVFLVLDAIGTALWVGLMVGLGYAIGHHAVDVVDKVNDYALYVTIGVVVVMLGLGAVRQRR